MISALAHALCMAALMGWEMLWALILGFFISGAIQAVVSHKQMARLLPDARWPSILKASALGAASSSCSYAAAAIARSVLQKGGNFTAAMAFQFASTNLVIELGLVLLTLIGWRFMAASWLGGVVMIVILVGLMRLLVSKRLTDEAKAQADRNRPGKMEGHAAMDMSVGGEGSIWTRLISPDGFTATAHFFVMDWASLWLDLFIGVVVAGALAAWVPASFWAHLFLTGHPVLAGFAGPFIGPLVAVLSFVCSVGNVPLAAVLWRGGASFGGVIAFIFADLIVLPILDIYRRYYGLKMAAVLFCVFYLAMALAGLVVEGLFALLHLTPTGRDVHVMAMGFAWNWTTWLNLAFLAVAAVLGWRFMTTGGPAMLRAMDAPDGHAGHGHST